MFHVKHSLDDTIVAIATPLGTGGVGVVRISGGKAMGIAGQMIDQFSEKIEHQKVYHGWIKGEEGALDEVLYYYMKAPHSYTGEEVVEINCHGGIAVLRAVLEAAIKAGARMAERGEFTKRAFLNKKLDLLQAEAVLDLITAPTEKGAGYAIRQLAGKLSKIVIKLRKKLLESLAKIEANIDFPDDVPEFEGRQLSEEIEQYLAEIEALLKTEERGRIYREGVAAVIIGKPNVGKSSLLNALLGEDRAIVTDMPGTTRDAIEEKINVKGVPLRIIDTAGIRHPKDKAEEFGVKRTEKEIESADYLIMVLDGSATLDELDKTILLKGKGKRGMVVVNKRDLGLAFTAYDLKKVTNGFRVVETSALRGEGISDLIEGIFCDLRAFGVGEKETAVAINSRHRECLMRAQEALGHAREGTGKGELADCIAIDLKEAIIALGEISGELVSEEVINAIFEKFCVGK